MQRYSDLVVNLVVPRFLRRHFLENRRNIRNRKLETSSKRCHLASNIFDSETEERSHDSLIKVFPADVARHNMCRWPGCSLFIECHSASHSIKHVKDVYALKSRRTTVSLRSCNSLTIEYRSRKVCRLSGLSFFFFFSFLL